MSALGHKRIFAVQNGMSALPPKADIVGDAGQTTSWPPKARHQSKSHSFSIIRTPIHPVREAFFNAQSFAGQGRNYEIGG